MFGRATIRLGIGPHSSFIYSTLMTEHIDCLGLGDFGTLDNGHAGQVYNLEDHEVIRSILVYNVT